MLPRVKKDFLAFSIFSWTAQEADNLYCHQTPKHLAAEVVEISKPARSNFSGSLCCCEILRTYNLDAFNFRLAFLTKLLITLACWLTASLDAAMVLISSAWIAAPA